MLTLFNMASAMSNAPPTDHVILKRLRLVLQAYRDEMDSRVHGGGACHEEREAADARHKLHEMDKAAGLGLDEQIRAGMPDVATLRHMKVVMTGLRKGLTPVEWAIDTLITHSERIENSPAEQGRLSTPT